MTDSTAYHEDNIEKHESAWYTSLVSVQCQVCKQAFLYPSDGKHDFCPSCGSNSIVSQSVNQAPNSPVLMSQFSKKKSDLRPIFEKFVNDVWFRPDNFSADKLLLKVLQVYLPMWSADCGINGDWQAEVGIDYQVKSSNEIYKNNRWQTQEVIETRLRWEPRLGQINLFYKDITVPAFRNWRKYQSIIGNFSADNFIPFTPQSVKDCIVWIPELSTNDVWVSAKSIVYQRSCDDCRAASGASQIRDYKANLDYGDIKWGQVLFPIYLSSYMTDDGKTHLIYVDGRNGTIKGPRYSSQRKGWMWAGIIFSLAIIIFLMALVLLALSTLFPPSLVLGTLCALLSVIVFILAWIPAIWPGQWNHKQGTQRDQ